MVERPEILSGDGPAMNRRILRLAVPSTVATLSVPLIGIVDTALVGHLPEVSYLGAVAVASVIFDVLYWGFGFLRMGTTALVAQYWGAGRRAACTEVLVQSCVIGLAAGLGFVLFRTVIADVGFGLVGGTGDVRLWGSRYFAVRIYGAPLVLVGFVLTGYFRGIADAVSPMWMTIVANVVNLVGDYGLIYGKLGMPEMGVVGAAWASVAAALCSLLYGLLILALRHRAHLTKLSSGLVDSTNLRRLLATNASLFGRTACLLFAQFFMLSTVARMGDVPLAANAVAWQVWSLVSYSVDGLAHAAETLVGNALGARSFGVARQVARRCLWWGGGLGLAFGCTYLVAMGPIAKSFTDHAPVITAVLSLTLWVAIIQPLNAMVFIWDGIFIGANDTLYLFGAMALAAFAIFLPATVVFVHLLGLGLQGAWMGYNGLMVGRFLTLGLRFRGQAWMRTFAARDCGKGVQP